MLSNEIKFLQKICLQVDIWFLISSLVLCPNQADTWGFRGSVTWYCNVTSSWHPQNVMPATEPCQGTLPYQMLPQVLQDEDATWAYKCTKSTKPHGLLPSLIKFLGRVSTFMSLFPPFTPSCTQCDFFVPCSMPQPYSVVLSTVTTEPKIKVATGVFLVPTYLFLSEADYILYLCLPDNTYHSLPFNFVIFVPVTLKPS